MNDFKIAFVSKVWSICSLQQKNYLSHRSFPGFCCYSIHKPHASFAQEVQMLRMETGPGLFICT